MNTVHALRNTEQFNTERAAETGRWTTGMSNSKEVSRRAQINHHSKPYVQKRGHRETERERERDGKQEAGYFRKIY